MKKNIGMSLLAAAVVLLSSCSQQKLTINGEAVQLEEPGIYAKMATNYGDILLELHEDKAPITVANFVALAEGKDTLPGLKAEYAGKPYYDGITFHRVIPNFMIQGGDPTGTGMGDPGYKFPDETDNGLSHKKGALSMANSGPNTNGSQFFITVAETKHLDGRHTVFGEVLQGQKVADSISRAETAAGDKPVNPITINTLEIIRQGKEAQDFAAASIFREKLTALEKAAEERAKEALKALEKYTAGAEQTASGLYYKVMEEGDGPKPEAGQKVKVHYAGYLPSGKMFDTSIKALAEENELYDARREPYDPFTLPVGPKARVIPGWIEGLQLMNVGDKYQLIIPPQLGYGDREIPGLIPANSWLIFDVEMVALAD